MAPSTATVLHGGPIFVLSWVRSGSTLLRFILDTHPQIAAPAEVELGALCQALVQALVPTVGLRAPGERGRRLVLDEIRRIAGDVMAGYAADKKKPLWCDKSPVNALYLRTLEAVFPDARYVCLYRDGVDVVHSCVGYRHREKIDALDIYVARAGSVLGGAVDAWLEVTDNMLQLEARRPDVCYRVHYERLVDDPCGVSRELFAWLGLTPDEGLIDRVFTAQHDPGDGDAKAMFSTAVDKRGVGRGRRLGASDIAGERRQRLEARLVELGYPPLDASATTSSTAAAPTAEQMRDELTRFLETMLPKRLRERAHGVRDGGTFRFVIDGMTPPVWILDLSGPKPYVAPVDRPMACTITLDATTFAGIVRGDANAATAYLDGRIQVDGDMALVRILRRLL